MVKLKLAGHTGWVSSVSWSPSSAYTLVSGSYDGTLKIWDVRSTSPLYTIAAATMPAAVGSDKSVPAKVLCTKWCAGQDMLVGGGEDGKLSIHSYAAATAAPVGMERVAK